MDILLSVQPIYVTRILSLEKRFEFRTRVPKEEVGQIYVYSSSPVQKIVASFDPDFITLKGTADEVWNQIKKCPGANKQELENYLHGRQGHAIHISDLKVFQKPIDPKLLFPGFRAPQSFKYCNLNKSIIEAKSNGI
jgi:predicted transcriptional regulator